LSHDQKYAFAPGFLGSLDNDDPFASTPNPITKIYINKVVYYHCSFCISL